jgi:hypothetical protein
MSQPHIIMHANHDDHNNECQTIPCTAMKYANLADFEGDIDPITTETAGDIDTPVAFLTDDRNGVKPPSYDLR